ncbi:MAG: DNA primase [Actinomycetota bacterium]|nr:DNA primase [Actinomycetota bacterium]
MGIAAEDIERVRAATDLVAVVGEHVALRRSGSRWVGLCPFHTERTPSFSVNPDMGYYFCFGCQAKGDAITFVRETRQLDFVGAVEALAARAGIELRWDNQRESGQRRRRARLLEAMARAVEWYHERLVTSPDGARARGYLRSRGYNGEVVRRFRLGWAPEGWDELCRALSLPADVARDTGLGFVNARNRLQDSFRSRVVFPIFDARGEPVALGGRILEGAGSTSGPGGSPAPKYKNSNASLLYDKGEVLYGLNWAKGAVVERGEVVVCEGYTDVIGLVDAGIPQAVATCGTALTERHVATLRRFAPRIVLAFDADGAGQAAAERIYGWERRYEVDVFVASFPPGVKDPADLARSDPDGLRAAVAGAVPLLSFRLDRLLAASPETSVEARARAAAAAAGLIAEHPNQIVREQYANDVALRLGVRPEHLLHGQGRNRASGHRAPVPNGAVSGRPPRRGRRLETASLLALSLAVHQPEAVAPLLHEVLFRDPVELEAYRALAGAATLHEAVAAAPPEAADLLLRLAVEEVPDADAGAVVGRLLDEAAGRVLAQMEAEVRAAAAPGDDLQTIGWLKLRVEDLREETTRPAAAEVLLPFLAGRAACEGRS